MLLSNHPTLRRGLLLAGLMMVAAAWLLVAVVPALAQGEETAELTMIERFYDQPDLAAPLVVPMILALGGIVSLLAFLGWVFNRLPEDGKS